MVSQKQDYAYQQLDRKPRSARCTTVLRWTSFCSAFLAISAAFSMFAFTVYLDSIKNQFRYSQSQVELLMSLEWLGMGATLPGGYFLNRFGIRWSSLVALIVPTGAHLLIWSACDHQSFYSENYGLLAFYFFLAGCGGAFTYLVAITATVGNFPEKTRCTVLSLLSSATSIGPMLYIAAFDAFFYIQPDYKTYHYPNSTDHLYTNYLKNSNATGHNPKNTEGRQDVGGYFLLVTLTYAVANTMSLIFHGEYPPAEDSSGHRSRKRSSASFTSSSSGVEDNAPLIQSEPSPFNHATYRSINELKDIDNSGEHQEGPGAEKSEYESADEGYAHSEDCNSTTSSDITPSSQEQNERYYKKMETLDDQNENTRLLQRPGKHEMTGDLDDLYAPTFVDVLRTPMFHYIAWPSVVLLGLGPMDANNLNTFLISMDLTDYIVSLPFVAVWSGIIGKVIIGYVSDKVVHVFPRGGFLFLACVVSAITYALSMALLGHVTVVIINQAVCNLAAVVIWCLIPSVLIEEFGESNFVLLWGVVQLFYGIAAFTLQYMLGSLYDVQLNIEDDDVTTCFGQMCFTWTFLICTVICAISSVLSGLYVWQRRDQFVCFKSKEGN